MAPVIVTGNNNNKGDNDMKTARTLVILGIFSVLIATIAWVNASSFNIPGARFPQNQSH